MNSSAFICTGNSLNRLVKNGSLKKDPYIAAHARFDCASSHLGRIARKLKKGKSVLGINDKGRSPCDFEPVADSIDGEDSLLSGENKNTQCGRPYLVSAGIESSINYIFTMSPIMTRIVTYDESREYLNTVAFNHTIMQWMVIARVQMDKLNLAAYCL